MAAKKNSGHIALNPELSPSSVFSSISRKCKNAFLLESCEGNEKMARFSFVGFSPARHIVFKGGFIYVNGKKRPTNDPLRDLEANLGRNCLASEGFVGGGVGYFSFDFARSLEEIQPQKGAQLFPDFEFGIYDDVIVFDHLKKEARYVYSARNRYPRIAQMLAAKTHGEKPFRVVSLKPGMSQEQFCRKVKKVKESIVSGEIFQAVISRRYEINFSGDIFSIYPRLKQINPSPYMYCLKFGERKIIGASPENLIRVEGRDITSYATLAGTRPRGNSAEDDKRLEQELLEDGKERAEHLMLVDLTRNDVGKVSEIGSVSVPELMGVQKFSHVQHMASLVCSRLKKGMTGFDAFRAIFPAGTVSGAPKIRAIGIISQMERDRRGPYGGAVGYFSSNGNVDFAICIRTLFAVKNRAFLQAGAGIVYDSIPEREFEETEAKAAALLSVMGVNK